jgi:ATP-dependent protease ClpP protease subunit/phage major head subunit gpT-like protein
MPDLSIPAASMIPQALARFGGPGTELFLNGDVGTEITTAGVQAFLRDVSPSARLTVRINSPGGVLSEAMAIYNALARHPGGVTVVVEGIAASAASLIAMAGRPIIMPANAFLMMHQPRCMPGIQLATGLRDIADWLDRQSDACVAIYAARSGQTPDKVRALLDAETWLSAEEAVTLGFANQIETPLAAVARLDLSAFNNVPPALAVFAGAGPHRETASMTTPTPSVNTPAPPVPPQPATLAELESIATSASLGAEFVVAQLRTGATEHVAREAAMHVMATRSPDRPGIVPSFSDGGLSNPQVRLAAMVGALAARMTGGSVAENVPARAYMAMPVVEMARELLEARGVAARRMSRDGVIDAIMSFGAHTTSDFPQLLTGAGRRVLADAYTTATSPLRSVLCKVRDVPDFRKTTTLRLGEFPALEKVSEHGEVTFGTAPEVTEGYKVETHARQFALTREMLINDDLGAFADTSAWAGAAAAETEARVLVNLLLMNGGLGPIMSDGKTLFHADHGNLASPGSAITEDSASAARTAMRKTKGLDGVTAIAVPPKFLLVSPDNETAADKLVTTRATADLETNAFAGKLTPLVEDRLDDKGWYLFADPVLGPIFEVAYLAGSGRQPDVKVFESAEFLGYRFRVVHDFGAGAIGWRGAYRNPGA